MSLRTTGGHLVVPTVLDDQHVATAICGLLSILTRGYVSESNMKFWFPDKDGEGGSYR